MDEFALSHSRRERDGKSVRVVAIDGELDAHTFPRLQDLLATAIAERERAIVLDCRKLDYISSAGLGVLNKMVSEMRPSGDIRLAGLSPKVNNIVNLLGFSKTLQVFGSVDEAVASF